MDSLATLQHSREQVNHRLAELVEKENARRSLVHTASLLKTILTQQIQIEASQSKDSHAQSSMKQDLSKISHEKKLLENKVTLLTSEVDILKKKSSNFVQLQKENMTLKNQISKLNSQLSESKNESGKLKQQFLTQKAVLESKLENAKKNIKSLKDISRASSPSKPNTQTILSSIKPVPGHEKLGLRKPLVSNFSTSPFLKDRRQVSPSKPPRSASTPVTIGKNIMAQSTPGAHLVSPLKDVQPQKPSSLKNLISPDKLTQQKKKPSLFDDDDDDDDDGFFANAIKKFDEKENEELIPEVPETQVESKKRKKKLGGKAIVEDDEEDLKFTPLKKVKLMDKIGGISPLKKRNNERGLFKV
jgi:myosin heavy subunit